MTINDLKTDKEAITSIIFDDLGYNKDDVEMVILTGSSYFDIENPNNLDILVVLKDTPEERKARAKYEDIHIDVFFVSKKEYEDILYIRTDDVKLLLYYLAFTKPKILYGELWLEYDMNDYEKLFKEHVGLRDFVLNIENNYYKIHNSLFKVAYWYVSVLKHFKGDYSTDHILEIKNHEENNYDKYHKFINEELEVVYNG